MKRKITLLVCAMLANSGFAASESIQNIFTDHFNTYKRKEFFSGAALSYSIPGQNIQNFYLGRVSHAPNAAPVSADTLFQIGSITKSFTAALLLKAEQAKQLSLHDTLVKWLPEYKNWPASITITELLDMTSNLPNYSDAPLWYAEETKNMKADWTKKELISFVYPNKSQIPLRKGYFYSNTGYVLSDLIYEKATKTSFDKAMQNLMQDADLKNTVYPLPTMTKDTRARLAHGYNYNPYDNPALVGKDVYSNNLSWAGAAGGILSTPEDVIKWVQHLFIDPKFLTSQQRKKLTALHSTATGKPLTLPNKDDSEGFGLGVAHMYKEQLGNFWFYEGITLGFRGIYMYKPCNGVIIAASFNSTPDHQNDASGKLMQQVYAQILKENPNLQCQQ